MTNLEWYLNDGANYQARAVLCLLQGIFYIDNLSEFNKPKVARWENCREQGYVITFRNSDYKKQLNIAFFEHRNSDAICAIKWEQNTMNSPTIDTAEFTDVYKDKYDTSFDVSWCEIRKMAEWISNELKAFWENNYKEIKK